MASLCHPGFTTTKLSYRFPIFETSATALRGTTGSNLLNAIVLDAVSTYKYIYIYIYIQYTHIVIIIITIIIICIYIYKYDCLVFGRLGWTVVIPWWLV